MKPNDHLALHARRRERLAALMDEGVAESKITLVRNALSRRPVSRAVDEDVIALARSRPTVLVAGQIAPFKDPDGNDLQVYAPPSGS